MRSLCFLAFSCLAVLPLFASQQTFCNPIVIENYPIGMYCRGLKNGDTPTREIETWKTPGKKVVQFRELADPSVIFENGAWYIYPSVDMCYKSTDMGATWTHIPLNLSGASGEEDKISYAPAIRKHRGKFLLIGGKARLFQGDSPEGPFVELGTLKLPSPPALWDADFFSDDDGRLYFYWGCTPTNGIWGIELDAKNPLKTIGEAKRLIPFEPETQPWEIAKGKRPRMGYLEGAWMVKNNGKYILTYAAAGTENKEYAMGQAISSSPMGPFVKPKNNPFFRKTKGFITGTSHGSIVKGPDDGWWVFYTINANSVHWFERRLGMDRIKFDKDGSIAVATASEVPQFLPTKGTGPVGWRRLVSRTQLGCEEATDMRFKTYWTAPSVPSSLRVDFDGVMIMRSFRIIWRDVGLDVERGVKPGPFFYRVEVLRTDGSWKTVCDESANKRDLLVDYREIEPVFCTACRLVILGAPAGITPGVVDFSPFGYH